MIALLLLACLDAREPEVAPAAPPEPTVAAPVDAFAAFLDPNLVGGFRAPVGDGWRSVGSGRWDHDGEAPVTALADGRVVSVTDDAVVVAHRFLENHVVVELLATVSGVRPAVAVGEGVVAGQRLGTATAVRLALAADSDEVLDLDDPAAFLADRATLLVPAAEPRLALVSHDGYELRRYEHGALVGTHGVSFGQAAGRKERRGDNRTPKGAYFAVQRSRGPFDGPVGPYYGGIWVRIDYPNPWDAARGLREGWITAADAAAIEQGWRARAATPKDTTLGGGIGFHAWVEEWSDDGPRHLSWGCIVVHVADRDAIYEFLSDGALVVLF